LTKVVGSNKILYNTKLQQKDLYTVLNFTGSIRMHIMMQMIAKIDSTIATTRKIMDEVVPPL
jgi:hypothetical protein